MIGRTLSHYRILQKLGQGGMGEVFLALDTLLNRRVALKFPSEDTREDTLARKRLLREAMSAATLDHPFICKIYEASKADGLDFIAMEYVEGRTLRDRIVKGSLPLKELLPIALEIAEALDAAHDHGIIHRDLKPSNIMLGTGGHIKVMDFGLAKQTMPRRNAEEQESTASLLWGPGAVVGTLDYMSPEQLRGQEVDTRSDIFSFGLILCELLNGTHPLRRSSPMDTASAILNVTPEDLPLRPGTIPAFLTHILRRMLEREADNRYQSVRDLLADLRLVRSEKLSSGQEAEKGDRTEVTALQTHGRIRQYRKAFAGAALGGLLVFAALIWYLLYPSRTVLGFQERNWIVVSDFENLTGEQLFDRALDSALRVSLEQSSYVNVLPKSRIEQSLQRMKKRDISRLNERTALEIAQREGVKILLVPSITGIAGKYVVSATLEDVATGGSLKSDTVHVQHKEDLLDAIDRLARDTRRSLGESRSAISQGKQLAKVTTSSLEALKQYSLGTEALRAARFEEARNYYESALQVDPEFTAAAASLGMINYERFDKEKGKQLLANAVRHIDNLTDREKYGILAFYANAVENNIPKTIQYWKMLASLYPDAENARNNLGWLYWQTERYPEAVSEYKEAIRINPSAMLCYNGLNMVYLYGTGDVSAAIELCLRQVAQEGTYFWAYDNLAWAYLGKGELERARDALEKALKFNINPKQQIAGYGRPYEIELFRLADVLRLQARYAEALPILKRIQEMFPGTSTDYETANIYQLMNDNAKAKQFFERYRTRVVEKDITRDPKNAETYINLALANLRLRRLREAEAAYKKASALDPQQHFGFAQYLSVQGNVEEALQQLELAVQEGWHNYVWMKVHPDFQNLYSDARFQSLVRRCIK